MQGLFRLFFDGIAFFGISDKFSVKTLRESLKTANDYLILDTPEMGKYADAYQIALFADATIFVVKAESTEKSAVKDIAKDARIHNPMLVLNAIDMTKKKYQYLYK